MTPLEKERLTAALELACVIQGLIQTSTVPEYMVDYLQARIARFERAFGVSMQLVEREDINA